MAQHPEVATPVVDVHSHVDVSGPAAAGRLLGVDLARGLAVLGMYAAHVGPDPRQGGVTGFLMELAHGRSAALFALLAGFTVALITGRSTPKTGRAGRQAVAKVVIRAVVLLMLGTALSMTGTPVEVILAYYGLYFLLVLPLHRLGAQALAVIAAATAIVCPQALYVVLQVTGPAWPDGDTTPDGIIALLFTGSYPALAWVPLVIAGMAIARLDLTPSRARIRLSFTAAALVVIGYGGSWLALHTVPGAATALSVSAFRPGAASLWWSDAAGYPSGETPAWLLVASPHSETTLSILGNAGVAIAVLVACLVATEAGRGLRTVARPVVAVGSMSLTAYVFHIVGIHILGIERLPGPPVHVLAGFVVAVSTFAAVWSRRFHRGPLEFLMAQTTGLARHLP